MGVVESLDEPGRGFIFEDMALTTFEKKFRYFEEGEKLLRMARGEVANISDVFYLMPVCLFTVCDKQAIRRFLQGEKRRNPKLLISSMEDTISMEQDFLGSRLSALYKNGFLMEMRYFSAPYRPQTLYSIPKEVGDLVTKKLDIRMIPEKWSSEMPVYKIFGKASAANVASYLSLHANYKCLGKGVSDLKQSRTVFLPEFEFEDSLKNPYIVGIYFGYLRHDERIHSRDQFEKSVMRRITFAWEYVLHRSHRMQSNLVLVMENTDDLRLFARAMLASGYFDEESLSRIYFTGEGIFLSAGEEKRKLLTGLFLRLCTDGSIEENVTPSFLR